MQFQPNIIFFALILAVSLSPRPVEASEKTLYCGDSISNEADATKNIVIRNRIASSSSTSSPCTISIGPAVVCKKFIVAPSVPLRSLVMRDVQAYNIDMPSYRGDQALLPDRLAVSMENVRVERFVRLYGANRTKSVAEFSFTNVESTEITVNEFPVVARFTARQCTLRSSAETNAAIYFTNAKTVQSVVIESNSLLGHGQAPARSLANAIQVLNHTKVDSVTIVGNTIKFTQPGASPRTSISIQDLSAAFINVSYNSITAQQPDSPNKPAKQNGIRFNNVSRFSQIICAHNTIDLRDYEISVGILNHFLTDGKLCVFEHNTITVRGTQPNAGSLYGLFFGADLENILIGAARVGHILIRHNHIDLQRIPSGPVTVILTPDNFIVDNVITVSGGVFILELEDIEVFAMRLNTIWIRCVPNEGQVTSAAGITGGMHFNGQLAGGKTGGRRYGNLMRIGMFEYSHNSLRIEGNPQTASSIIFTEEEQTGVKVLNVSFNTLEASMQLQSSKLPFLVSLFLDEVEKSRLEQSAISFVMFAGCAGLFLLQGNVMTQPIQRSAFSTSSLAWYTLGNRNNSDVKIMRVINNTMTIHPDASVALPTQDAQYMCVFGPPRYAILFDEITVENNTFSAITGQAKLFLAASITARGGTRIIRNTMRVRVFPGARSSFATIKRILNGVLRPDHFTGLSSYGLVEAFRGTAEDIISEKKFVIKHNLMTVAQLRSGSGSDGPTLLGRCALVEFNVTSDQPSSILATVIAEGNTARLQNCAAASMIISKLALTATVVGNILETEARDNQVSPDMWGSSIFRVENVPKADVTGIDNTLSCDWTNYASSSSSSSSSSTGPPPPQCSAVTLFGVSSASQPTSPFHLQLTSNTIKVIQSPKQQQAFQADPARFYSRALISGKLPPNSVINASSGSATFLGCNRVVTDNNDDGVGIAMSLSKLSYLAAQDGTLQIVAERCAGQTATRTPLSDDGGADEETETPPVVVANNAVQGTTMAASAFAAGSTPAFSFTVARQQAMTDFTQRARTGDCSGVPAGGADSIALANSPTQMSVGGSKARYQVGAIIGDIVLTAGCMLLAQVAGALYLRHVDPPESENWKRPYVVFAKCHVSMVMFICMALFTVPVVNAALITVALSSVPIGARAISVILALAFMAATAVYAIWGVVSRDRVEKFKRFPAAQDEVSNLKRIYSYWFDRAGMWKLPAPNRNSNNNSNSSSRHQNTNNSGSGSQMEVDEKVELNFGAANPMIDGFTDSAPWFILVEFGSQLGIVFATLLAQVVPTKQSCVAQGVVLILDYVVYIALCVWKRPFQIRFSRVFIPVSAFFQLSGIVAALAAGSSLSSSSSSSSSDDEDGGDGGGAAVVVAVVVSALSLEAVMSILLTLANTSRVLRMCIRFVQRIRRRAATATLTASQTGHSLRAVLQERGRRNDRSFRNGNPYDDDDDDGIDRGASSDYDMRELGLLSSRDRTTNNNNRNRNSRTNPWPRERAYREDGSRRRYPRESSLRDDDYYYYHQQQHHRRGDGGGEELLLPRSHRQASASTIRMRDKYDRDTQRDEQYRRHHQQVPSSSPHTRTARPPSMPQRQHRHDYEHYERDGRAPRQPSSPRAAERSDYAPPYRQQQQQQQQHRRRTYEQQEEHDFSQSNRYSGYSPPRRDVTAAPAQNAYFSSTRAPASSSHRAVRPQSTRRDESRPRR